MQKRHRIRVEFGAHVRAHLIESWRGGLAYCGDVTNGPEDRVFFVEVRRDALLERLKGMLVDWEREGTVRWSEVTDVTLNSG